MTLHKIVIIRVYIAIVQNRGNEFNDQLTLPVLLCIICISIVFGGILKRFQWVLVSLFSSPCNPPESL